MNTPTTSWPARLSSHAATDESTPPDNPTTMRCLLATALSIINSMIIRYFKRHKNKGPASRETGPSNGVARFTSWRAQPAPWSRPEPGPSLGRVRAPSPCRSSRRLPSSPCPIPSSPCPIPSWPSWLVYSPSSLASWLPCRPSSPQLHPAWRPPWPLPPWPRRPWPAQRRERLLAPEPWFARRRSAIRQRRRRAAQSTACSWSLSSVLWVGWSTLETVSPPLTRPCHKRLTERHYRPDSVHRQLAIGQPRDSA